MSHDPATPIMIRDRRPRKWRRMIPQVLAVREILPDSWFTKRGPGVEATARAAFRALDPAGKWIAVRRGWIPGTWL